jgi:hypothetical protein
MRLWSLHPTYLDSKGLVALWREALLARKVLQGQTKGYRNHPQLIRFREAKDPMMVINTYLWEIFEESISRGYHFDGRKVVKVGLQETIPVTSGQVQLEVKHLLTKLEKRDKVLFLKFREVEIPMLHPLFTLVPGAIESWERFFDNTGFDK